MHGKTEFLLISGVPVMSFLLDPRLWGKPRISSVRTMFTKLFPHTRRRWVAVAGRGRSLLHKAQGKPKACSSWSDLSDYMEEVAVWIGYSIPLLSVFTTQL